MNLSTEGNNSSTGKYEIIIVTLSNGHIIPVKLNKETGETWQGHLVGGNLSWRLIDCINEIDLPKQRFER